MKIGIIGTGAMASLYGGKLSNENQVTFYGSYKANVDAINIKGLLMEDCINDCKEHFNNINAFESIDSEDAPVDLAIIFVKSTMTGSSLKKYTNIIGPRTLVLTLQNGVGNIEEIKKFVKEKNIIGGTSAHGATMLGPGHFRHAGTGTTYIGYVKKREDKSALEEIKDIFNKAGIYTEIKDDPQSIIWGKLISNVGLNALSGITGFLNGAVSSNPYTYPIMKDLCNEAYEVSKALGIKLSFTDPVKHCVKLCERTAPNKSSMLQDILNKRETEIDAINGAICRYGKELGIDTPANKIVTLLIKSLEGKNSL